MIFQKNRTIAIISHLFTIRPKTINFHQITVTNSQSKATQFLIEHRKKKYFSLNKNRKLKFYMFRINLTNTGQ